MTDKNRVLTTVSGRDSEQIASLTMTTSRLKLLARAVDKGELLAMYSQGLPYANIGEKLDIAARDVRALTLYWEFPERSPHSTGQKAVDIDILAERLWLVIQPKVKALVEEMLGS